MATRAEVLQYMKDNVKDHVDTRTGEVNETGLAEDAAWHFNKDKWLDDPDHWIWEMASRVCDSHLAQQK